MGFNIVYFATIGQTLGGVEQKIISQFDALIHYNSKVYLYFVSSYIPNQELRYEIEKRDRVFLLVNTIKNLKNPLTRRKEKFALMGEVLRKFKPTNTICYIRYPNADLIFYNFLKMFQSYTIITEHQEIENTFRMDKFNGNYLRNLSEILLGRIVRKQISGFVGVTTEITDYEIKVSGQLNKSSITIGNGINVQKYPVRCMNMEEPAVIKMLFIGAGYRTHGLFRLLNSLAFYKKSGAKEYSFKLKIAGNSHYMNKNKILVKKLNISDWVDFLYEQNNKQLDELFNWADIGIGSLGLHSIGLKISSTLKVREYITRGLPFLMSTFDNDLPDNFEFVMRLESSDNLFDMTKVVDFTQKTRKCINHPGKMHDYALECLDWSVKMKKLHDFLDSILSANIKKFSIN